MGVVCKESKLSPSVPFQHTIFLYRDALAAKDIEPGLHMVMNTAVTIVNLFIILVKARATNCRLFTSLCEEVGADYHPLFMTQS